MSVYSIFQQFEHWLLGNRYTEKDREEPYKEFREKMHENRNARMIADYSVRKSTEASEHTYDVANIAIERLQQARDAVARRGENSDA